jgi:hypothetical protein
MAIPGRMAFQLQFLDVINSDSLNMHFLCRGLVAVLKAGKSETFISWELI